MSRSSSRSTITPFQTRWRFCHVGEAETLLRQACASPRSSPPLRWPAPYPSSRRTPWLRAWCAGVAPCGGIMAWRRQEGQHVDYAACGDGQYLTIRRLADGERLPVLCDYPPALRRVRYPTSTVASCNNARRTRLKTRGVCPHGRVHGATFRCGTAKRRAAKDPADPGRESRTPSMRNAVRCAWA
jgi:hypothetical protein